MKNRLILLVSFIALISSCSDNFGEMNKDIKNPTTTLPEYLFTNAEKAMMDQVTSTSVNNNVFRLFAQQWTETTYTQETQYRLNQIPDKHWAVYYRNVLKNFKEAKQLLTAQNPNNSKDKVVIENKIAIIDILSAYSYGILVDTFGDIPYTEALDIDGHPQPKYDDAKTIYKDLMDRLTATSHKLDKNTGSYGDADLIYGGNTAKWAKFANSLRLRMAIMMDDVDHAYANTQALDALADGVISDSADGAYMPYAMNATNNNPLYIDLVSTGRDDFVPADTFVNKLNELADPRRAKYFTEYEGSGQYKGGVYGVDNIYADFSHITKTIKDPVYPGVIFTYSEVEFLLAEAIERDIPVGGGSAADHYTNAVKASLQDWGVATTDITAYLAKPEVAYATATGTWKQKIGEQAWIAYYNRGFEAWTSYRRLDFPVLKAPPLAYDITEVPKRYSYPEIEQTLNAANLQAAVTKLGNNALTTHIFWDKY